MVKAVIRKLKKAHPIEVPSCPATKQSFLYRLNTELGGFAVVDFEMLKFKCFELEYGGDLLGSVAKEGFEHN